MLKQLLADVLGIGRRYRFVQLAFVHPVNSHRVTGGGDAAIPPAVDRNKINHVVRFPVLRLPLIKCVTSRVFAVWRDGNFEIRLEKPVAQNAQSLEHGAAQDSRVNEWRAINVFDHVWLAGFNQHFPHRLDQPGPLMAVAIALGEV